MNVIKFHAWVGKVNKMFYFGDFQICAEYDQIAWGLCDGDGKYELLAGQSSLPSNEKKDYMVMQYTGLKDKNGKELYHKDMAKWQDNFFVIGWDTVHGCWYGEPHNDNPIIGILTAQEFVNTEVIGNIYENPKLLDSINMPLEPSK